MFRQLRLTYLGRINYMAQLNNEVPVVTYKIPQIEIYQITDDELQRIEEGTKQVSQDYSLMLTCISICISLIVALVSGTFNPIIRLIFTVAVGVSLITAIYTGLKWIRHRKTAPNVFEKIRSRKEEPKI